MPRIPISAMLLPVAVAVACVDGGPDAATVPASISIEPRSVALLQLESVDLTAIVRNRAGDTLRDVKVTWSSHDPAIVSINAAGRAVALATARDRSTTISASVGSVRDEIPVAVRSTPGTSAAASLELRGPAAPTTLYWPGGTALYTVVARTASGAEIPGVIATWTSSDPSLVSVASSPTDGRSGVAAVLGSGQVTITATVGAKTVATTVVGVISPDVQLRVWPDTSRIPIAMSRTLRAERVGAYGPLAAKYPTGGSWETSDATIATVDNQGRIRAVGEGHARITAAFGERKVSGEVFTFRNTTPPRFTQIAAGSGHACGLTADGTAYCWGYNSNGQLGTTEVMDRCVVYRCSEVPIAVATTVKFASIAAGGWNTCGLTVEGALYCWGMAYNIGAGLAGTGAVFTPTRVASDRRFIAVSIGLAETCAITVTNDAYCWGNNSEGQLGDGTMANLRLTPVLVGGDLRWRDIRPDRTSCGVTTDSVAYCWGGNYAGQAGSPNAANVLTPFRVPTAIRFAKVASGTGSACGLAATMDVYCWGFFNQSNVPTLVPAPAKFVSLDNRGDPCAVTADGDTYCLGTGFPPPKALSRSAPGFQIKQLAMGSGQSCALNMDGVAYCWARDATTAGSFFDGMVAPTVPTPVPGQAP